MTTLGPIQTTSNPLYWSNDYSNTNGETAIAYAQRFGRTGVQGELARAFGRRGNRGARRILYALLGATAGGAATESYTRIVAPTPFDILSTGGVRAVESFSVNAGVTTAAQLAYLQTLTLRNFGASITYPTDASGNGGGGKGGR